MDNEEQRTFLINMLKVMIVELIVYKGFVENLKGSGQQAEAVDDFLAIMRRDPIVKIQLGEEFTSFVADAIQGPESDASLALRAFIEGWTQRSEAN